MTDRQNLPEEQNPFPDETAHLEMIMGRLDEALKLSLIHIYKDVKERSAIARFKVKGEDAYILAWTTTPWTLPSNVGLCVNPNEDYVRVKNGDYVYYLAEALCDTVLEGEYTVLERYKGKELEYKEYEPLFDFAVDICEKQHKKAFYVVCDTYVTLTDGTGVVHIAPAFGEDDSKVGRKYDLPFVPVSYTHLTRKPDHRLHMALQDGAGRDRFRKSVRVLPELP